VNSRTCHVTAKHKRKGVECQVYYCHHNPYGFSVWMAGGGIKGGKIIGATDEIGLRAAEDKVHMHDLHATILSLLGLDHKKLTYFFQGRDFRLTDVGGENNLAARLTVS